MSIHRKQAEARVGRRAGPYHLEQLLDVGGMAAVYLARRDGHRVALKLLHDAYASMSEARVRFEREVYVANRIQHEDVVEVLDTGTTDEGNPFYVMELLRGASLDKHLAARGSLAPEVVVTVAERLLDILTAAHSIEVWHRDIKPGNVFVTRDGTVKLLDFGLAYVGEASPVEPPPGAPMRRKPKRLTRAGTVIGTAIYMSPEQAMLKHDEIDGRADLFSVGALMFRCLTGRRLHDVEGQANQLLAAATRRAPSLARHGQFRKDLVAIVDRALAFEPEARWPDAASMRAALARVAVARAPVDTEWPATSDAPDESDLEIPISVSIHESEGAPDETSIIVEFESEHRYELRPRPGDQTDDPFDVIALDDPFDD